MDKAAQINERALLLYTTIGGLSDAETLADELVERGLAACVNIIPGVMSVYKDHGKMTHDTEAIMIIKSRENLKTRLLEGIKRFHPYELPAIMVIPPEECDEDYLQWIRKNTASKGRGVH